MNEEKRIEREKCFISKMNVIHNGKYITDNVHFVNNTTKVELICPIHGTFLIAPKNILNGQGCSICGKEKAKQCHKGNYELFVSNLKKKFGDKFSVPNIEKEYENNHSIITLKCNRCGEIINVRADYVVSDKFNGCNSCQYRFTYKELLKHNSSGNKIIPFDGLKDSRIDNVTLYCEEHGEYELKVSTIIDGRGECRKCNGHKKLMKEEDFFEKLHNMYGDDVKSLSKFSGTMIPMEFECNRGHKFKRTPNSFLFQKIHMACPICSKEAMAKERTKTTEQFIEEGIKLYGEQKYDFSKTAYEKSSKHVTIKCNECGRYFTITPNSFLKGHGCPYHNCNSSIMEKEIRNTIKELGMKCVTNSRNILPSGKELDMYIPSKKLAIEFDGLYWHNERNKDKNYHLDKTIECEKLGIKLIHIFEDEWNNKREIVSDLFGQNIDVFNKIIDVDDCVIGNVTEEYEKQFLDNNHLMGNKDSSIRYGLYYEDELVSMMTFDKYNDGYILLRMCDKRKYSIKGAEKKLFEHFINTQHPSKVISCIDRRLDDGKLLKDLGFSLSYYTQPNYYYVVGMERKDEQYIIENYDIPQGKDVHQFCLDKKIYRIYDCGCSYYEWNKDDKEINN